MRWMLASLALALVAQCVVVLTAGCMDQDPFCEVRRCRPGERCVDALEACVAERVDHHGIVHLFIAEQARCGQAGITDTTPGAIGPRCARCQEADR